MRQFQIYKDAALAPVIEMLAGLGVTPFMVTMVSATVVTAGLALSWFAGRPLLFIVALWLHVFLDGVDGALARRQTPEPTGGMADALADAIGVVAASIFLLLATQIPWSLVVAYTTLYLVVLATAIMRSRQGRPYLFVVRPRLLVYVALSADVLLVTAYTGPLLYLLTAILALFAASGIWVLVQPSR